LFLGLFFKGKKKRKDGGEKRFLMANKGNLLDWIVTMSLITLNSFPNFLFSKK
jgi:hypothetical protein